MFGWIQKCVMVVIVFLSFQAIAFAAEPVSNVLILFGNEWTAFTHGYHYNYDNSSDYDGYFDSDKYYEYQKKIGFVPVGRTYNHYTPGGGAFWSGNFLNWITMSNADFVRKTFTGGKRSKDSNKLTRLERASIRPRNAWKVRYAGLDLERLVPAAYADQYYEFYNSGVDLIVRNARDASLVSEPLHVQVEVCVDSMPEVNCVYYGNHYKPEGFLQMYSDKVNFGLMSYSVSQMREGGILRLPIGSITKEFSQTSGTLSQRAGAIKFINDIEESRGWNPLAEKYYEALRYLKGNESGQAAYCGNGFVTEQKFPVYGCDSRKPWIDPGSDPRQKTTIIIVSDDYPSKDMDSIPGSVSNQIYVDMPMNFGANFPYNPDVSALTNLIGDAEGISGTQRMVANVAGQADDNCNLQIVPSLSEIYGICPAEPRSEGTFYSAGLAYEGFIGDLRPDLVGRQNVETMVLAYRASAGSVYIPTSLPMSPMMLIAKYGGFIDRNSNGLPDLSSEWDWNGDGLPDNFFYAENGKQLLDSFGKIFVPSQ